MFRVILWIAGGAVALLIGLAVGRNLMDVPQAAAPTAPAAEEAAAPAAAVAPAPPLTPPVAAPPVAADLQVEEDAAATGMTTVEPDTAAPTPDPDPKPPT